MPQAVHGIGRAAPPVQYELAGQATKSFKAAEKYWPGAANDDMHVEAPSRE